MQRFKPPLVLASAQKLPPEASWHRFAWPISFCRCNAQVVHYMYLHIIAHNDKPMRPVINQHGAGRALLLASQHSHLVPSDFSRCAVSGDTAVCVVLQGCLSFLLSVVSPNSQNNCFQKFLSQHYLPLELHKGNTSLVHSPHHMCVPTVSVCAFSVGSRFKRYDHLVCYFCLSVYTFYIYMNWNQ